MSTMQKQVSVDKIYYVNDAQNAPADKIYCVNDAQNAPADKIYCVNDTKKLRRTKFTM
jgi:predicted lipase